MAIRDATSEGLEQYLKVLSEMVPGGFESAVRQLGVCKPGQKLPKGIKQRKKKQCFKNAMLLAQERGWTYCEGFAHAIIPMHHAWVLDDKGNIVDPTWDEPEKCFYAGIPFDTDKAIGLCLKSGVYGLFYTRTFLPFIKDFEKLKTLTVKKT